MINYNNKKFRPVKSSVNSETTSETLFVYKQNGRVLTSEYSGGSILLGHLLGTVNDKGVITMRYHQINANGELMTGKCTSKPELLPNGKIRLYEEWQWTNGDHSVGTSILEEI